MALPVLGFSRRSEGMSDKICATRTGVRPRQSLTLTRRFGVMRKFAIATFSPRCGPACFSLILLAVNYVSRAGLEGVFDPSPGDPTQVRRWLVALHRRPTGWRSNKPAQRIHSTTPPRLNLVEWLVE